MENDLKMLEVGTLGACDVRSPLDLRVSDRNDFIPESVFIHGKVHTNTNGLGDENGSYLCQDHAQFEKAGPRQQIFFEPSTVTTAIVTCGGICPGLNNVIRSAYMELVRNYKVKKVLGIRFGYAGLNPECPDFVAPIELTLQFVKDIHALGGTALGTSRGPQDPAKMVDFLVANDVSVLLCVGGDGTQRGAHTIAVEVARRGLKIAVVGIPKTIDNDIPYVSKAFGYSTALEAASAAILAAHTEARGGFNGIGLVKLMGRDAGFIAAGAALCSQEVNYVLIPEVAFPLEGEDGLLKALEARMAERHHAVIVVAEGAGQHLFSADVQRRKDASGNVKAIDIGPYLQDRIIKYFQEQQKRITLKYIDPSYIIRSVAANTHDRMLCDRMARNAVHAAMAGKTDVLVGFIHDQFIHVPICVCCNEKKRIRTDGELWSSVVLSTGQPDWK